MPSDVEESLYKLLSEQEGMFDLYEYHRQLCEQVMKRIEEKNAALSHEKIEQESKGGTILMTEPPKIISSSRSTTAISADEIM